MGLTLLSSIAHTSRLQSYSDKLTDLNLSDLLTGNIGDITLCVILKLFSSAPLFYDCCYP